MSPEQGLLLLTCRPCLGAEEEDKIRRLVSGDLDWDLVLWRAEIFGTMAVLHYHVDRLGLRSTLPAHVEAYLATWSQLVAMRADILQTERTKIVQTLDRYGLHYFLLKGAAIAPLYYPDPSIRHMLDLDIMIQQDDFPLVRDLMFGHGYRHGVWVPETNEVIEIPDPTLDLLSHHEFPAFHGQISVPNRLGRHSLPEAWKRKHLKFSISPTTITFNVWVDMHYNLAVGLDIGDVWQDVERRHILGHAIPVQSPTDMIWFIAARLYNETFQHNAKKLIMLGDLHSIILSEGARIDWTRILAIAEKYKLGPAIFYVLSHLERLTGVGVPSAVLEQLTPDVGGLGEGNDWGDFMPKLLGVPIVHDLCISE